MVAVTTGRVAVDPVGWTLLVGTVVALGVSVAVRRAAWREPSGPVPFSVDGALAEPDAVATGKPVIPGDRC